MSKEKTISKADKQWDEIQKRQRTLSDAFRNLENVAEDLDELSRSCHRLGKDALGMELDNDSTFITSNIKIIKDEIAKQIGEDFKQSIQSSETLLKGILAGISIGEGKKPKDIVKDLDI